MVSCNVFFSKNPVAVKTLHVFWGSDLVYVPKLYPDNAYQVRKTVGGLQWGKTFLTPNLIFSVSFTVQCSTMPKHKYFCSCAEVKPFGKFRVMKGNNCED